MIRLLFAAVVFTVLSCNYSSNIKPEEYAENNSEEYPHDFMFMQRAYPTGQIKTEAYKEAIQWKKQQIIFSSFVDKFEMKKSKSKERKTRYTCVHM